MRATFRRVSLVVVMMVAGMAGAGQPAPRETGTVTREAVRERLADILAGEDYDRVEFAVSTFDQAMEWIYLAVDTYLDSAIPKLGGPGPAGEYGAEILGGLEDHKVRWADDNGLDLVGERTLLVSSPEEARQLGELLLRTALLIREAGVGHGVAIRSAARKVFETMLPVEGTGQSLVTQYVVRLRMMTESDRKALLELLRD